jgi:hypothetical protein
MQTYPTPKSPQHEDVLKSGAVAARIFNLGTRLRWVVTFKPRQLYPRRKSHRYTLNMKLSVRAGMDAVVKRKSSCPSRESNVGRPARSLVTTLTERSSFCLPEMKHSNAAKYLWCHEWWTVAAMHYTTSKPEDGGSKALRNVGTLPQHYTASKPEDRGSMALRNVGILLQHYTASQPRRPRLASSPSWSPQRVV